jgi:hypothetical protein
MRAVTLPTNFLDDVLAAVDSKDVHRFVSYLTEDCVFRFGSAPAAVGRAAIGEAVGGFFESIAGCGHAVGNVWHDEGNMVCEGEVCYRRHDGSEITLPFVNVFEFCGELISNYKIYIDVGPLYTK